MKALILSQLQEQMNAAVECIQEERYAEAIMAYNECAKLVQLLQIEREIPADKQPKQITLEIE